MVGIVTYHASYNYGSMLQAYALQTFLSARGYESRIVNLRPTKQKEYYKTCFHPDRKGWKNRLRRLVYAPYRKALLNQSALFESFLHTQLKVTDAEYAREADLLRDTPAFDCWICGSDQIWNLECLDFDWSYFLSFVKEGKKIAYAPSFGPHMNASIRQEATRIGVLIRSLDYVSVREKGSYDIAYALSGREATIVADPTWLLPAETWMACAGDTPIVDGDYIFFYVPRYEPEHYALARRLSRRLHKKVVVSNLVNWRVIADSFEKELNTGPFEFLNLIRHASLVCSGSFHAVVFSLLFRVPFWAVNGMRDSRIGEILTLFDMQDRSLTDANFADRCDVSLRMDFSGVDTALATYRQKSVNYLQQALTS